MNDKIAHDGKKKKNNKSRMYNPTATFSHVSLKIMYRSSEIAARGNTGPFNPSKIKEKCIKRKTTLFRLIKFPKITSLYLKL